ncbi:Fic family protein [Virgibacillus dakarensis]|uniref:Fic family protein n=1 Tax=Virgibacillus dakarensis TaxID=1917889 RepID=UPI000B449D48|nr:Fic family protein [Virgibacillus dakarensis]
MKNKYTLSQKENIFLAKKVLVRAIYNSARLEGINVTFPQTKTIMEGVSVSNVSVDDVQTILNLRNAWRYVLNHLKTPFDLDFAKKINGYVSYNESLDWGVLRYGNVGITDVAYQPDVPDEKEVKKQLDDLLKIENETERAITYMLWGMRSQLFWDGNKRTSTICANKILIENGNGILTVPENQLEEFNERLSAFYETNDYSKINQFLYDKCLFGIDYV